MSWSRFVQLFDGFNWDDGNRAKILSRMEIGEVEQVFYRDPIIREDISHSIYEPRYVAMGPGISGRILHVAYTFRLVNGVMQVRVISARYMHEKERTIYEEIKKILQENK